ncbi:glucokinase [Spirochaeta thermophila]|uniref:Glucokinase n=1 Tax=Winmispira thermophila (strain ATCC 49972 / DSM 6192 / RI 19.B1) TaxID=665571 RepID=E0RR18_WINT6|nr:glucokinase [Spirochaeta thermophila]ADN01596.1 glucokinase [Spirochaeta thermophila DSM 6192]
MKREWFSQHPPAGAVLLAADIGGTNTNIALFEQQGGRLAMLAHWEFASRELANLEEALSQVIEDLQETLGTGIHIHGLCASGAGPVEENVCHLTNLPWIIDGEAIHRDLGVKTVVINDFSAICYGVPILESQAEEKLVPIPHTDGRIPPRRGVVRAVIGAGTGLGVGFLVEDRGEFHAYPSEGGHIDFPADDEGGDALRRYLASRYAPTPDAEAVVSGQGIANIFAFLVETGRIEQDETTRTILSHPPEDRPPLIARHRSSHEGCRRTMELFARLYGHIAAAFALTFLPTAGLYLAGGIAAKNLPLFLESPAFMEAFEANCRPNIRAVLSRIPVYIITDYSISLYGAAYAAGILIHD